MEALKHKHEQFTRLHKINTGDTERILHKEILRFPVKKTINRVKETVNRKWKRL